MVALLTTIIQFALHLNDPQWSCEVTHRDPSIAGTYYLYCSQMTPDGVELVTVGRFISDAKASKVTP
jgi:hypothetical protein